MEPFTLVEQEYFLIKDWDEKFPGLTAGFTTKSTSGHNQSQFGLNFGFHVNDHHDAVCQSRETLSELIDFPLDYWVGAEQTHEVHIKKVSKDDRGKGSNSYDNAFKQTDGFFTTDEGILLTLCFADCVPLYFISADGRAVGIAHAGWKGTVNGIAEEMIRVFEKEGITRDNVSVVIGPSICENCYIVDEPVIKMVQNRLDDVGKKTYNTIKEGQYSLNLRELNKLILLNCGLSEEQIRMTSFCTSCHHSQFFSHRRDRGKTGRMMSFIGWKEALQK